MAPSSLSMTWKGTRTSDQAKKALKQRRLPFKGLGARRIWTTRAGQWQSAGHPAMSTGQFLLKLPIEEAAQGPGWGRRGRTLSGD